MQRLTIVVAALVIASCQPGEPFGANIQYAEEELRRADLDQSRIVQAGDLDAITALLHPSYTVHLPDGRLVSHEQTLSMVKAGRLATEKHHRAQEQVLIQGDTGVVMGVDHLDSPPPLARNGERTRRYTNIYVRQDGRWKLLARHFHFMPNAPSPPAR